MKNLDKLQINKKYKYKELCVLFEEEIESGNSKKAQIKIWKSYFKWSNP